MAFTFKHAKAILETWLSYVVGHSNITDINPGSVTRTFGEATAIEIGQSYVQMRSILNLFSIDKASGSDLDERALDYDIERNQPTKSTGLVTITDTALANFSPLGSTLITAVTAGATSISIASGDYPNFPNSGTIVIDRGTNIAEVKSYVKAGGDGSTALTLSTALANAHTSNTDVHISSVGSSRPVNAGTIVKTSAASAVRFSVATNVMLLDGDTSVSNVLVQSVETGSDNNVNPGTITVFESAPFPTAAVINPANTKGGMDYEEDPAFRARLKASQQDLSSSTASKVESEALRVSLDDGQQVISAKLVEPVSSGVSILYISDGTATYEPTSQAVISEVLVKAAKLGTQRTGFKNWPLVSNSEFLFVSRDRGTSTSVSANTLTDSSKSWTVNQWQGNFLIDLNGSIYNITSNTATSLTVSAGGGVPASGIYALVYYTNTTYASGGSLLVRGTDYTINNTNGQVQLSSATFPTGLALNDCVMSYAVSGQPGYQYYDGLLQAVQKTMNGDPSDLVDFPGIKACGTTIQVSPPTLVNTSIQISVTPTVNTDISTLITPVENAVLTYVNSLGIGDNMLISKIIDACLNVSGVDDVTVISPTANVVTNNSQLVTTSLSSISVT